MAPPVLPVEACFRNRQPPLALASWRLFAFSPGEIIPARVARWRTRGGGPKRPRDAPSNAFLTAFMVYWA